MVQTRSRSRREAAIREIKENNPVSCRLFNDVHFDRQAPLPPRDAPWAPFPRLPAELRSQVWLFFLRRHRMIEVDICGGPNENGTDYPGDASQSRYYCSRNSLGQVVSGRGYILRIPGRRGYAASLSPLLWVNTEARQAALRFYHIRLPLAGLHGGQLLYLNREYDIVFVRVQPSAAIGTVDPHRATLLADFLHDAKAYDSKAQGCGYDNLPFIPFSCI